MATISQIRGMLLEEAVLQLLRTASYSPVDRAGSDPTLHNGPAGLEIYGRGGKHQADAVADFRIVPPFSNPQRLIVEAKCYSPQYAVGLPIIRNAVGVLKDISEWWVPPRSLSGIVATGRYHYQYVIFSASGYTLDAERYAFAQDIYLIPYERSRFIAPVVQAIRQLTHIDFEAEAWNAIYVDMSNLRRAIRNAIRGRSFADIIRLSETATTAIDRFVEAVSKISGTLLAIAGRRFPIHLIPAPQIELRRLQQHYNVRIRWDDQSWYLTDARSGQDLFSFDLPPELFSLYAEHGNLTESRALDLKSEMLNRIQALLTLQEETKLITFELDKDWILRVRERIQQLPHRREEEVEHEDFR